MPGLKRALIEAAIGVALGTAAIGATAFVIWLLEAP
jgi:hypothetical protein